MQRLVLRSSEENIIELDEIVLGSTYDSVLQDRAGIVFHYILHSIFIFPLLPEPHLFRRTGVYACDGLGHAACASGWTSLFSIFDDYFRRLKEK